jgi:acyl dehydratase
MSAPRSEPVDPEPAERELAEREHGPATAASRARAPGGGGEPGGLWYEDLAPGLRFETPTRTVTEADVQAFAALSGDQNRIHTDAEFARRTPFRRRVAHGLLVQSIATGLAHRAGIFEGTIVAIVEMTISFEAPVFPGDTLRATLEVLEREPEPSPRRGWVRFAVEVLAQDGRVVTRGTWRTLQHRRRTGSSRS